MALPPDRSKQKPVVKLASGDTMKFTVAANSYTCREERHLLCAIMASI